MTSVARHSLILLLGAAAALTACNSDDEPSVLNIDTTPSSAAVTKFSLSQDTRVLSNLDSVYFSIDLVRGEIFNAESMPVGTRVNGLVVEMSTPTISKAELTFPAHSGVGDTTVSYLDNPGDSINFADGPVTLKITAADGLTEATYRISVNVHRMDPDTLNWHGAPLSALPTSLGTPEAQKTARSGNLFLCLTRKGNQYCAATATDPLNGQWAKAMPEFGFAPRIETLSATDGAFFILSKEGALYESPDGRRWTATGQAGWSWIYGAYDGRLLGASNTSGCWQCVSFPPAAPIELPDGMPVEGTTSPSAIAVSWSALPQIMVVGGRKPDGSLSPDSWGFDGSRWAKTSAAAPLPQGIEGACLVPYQYWTTSPTNWRSAGCAVTLLIGGRLADGSVNKIVYATFNNGIIWSKAPDKLQLPEYLRPVIDAQAIVADVTLYPTPAQKSDQIRRRVSRPVSQWTCPYIFMFGGTDEQGALSDAVWRGAINRLTFIPLQ